MLYENNNSRSGSTINSKSPPPNPQHKIALITRITSQDGLYLIEFFSTNGFLGWFQIYKNVLVVGGFQSRFIWGCGIFILNLWVLQIMCCICRCACDQASMVLSQIVFLDFLGNQTKAKKEFEIKKKILYINLRNIYIYIYIFSVQTFTWHF